MLIRSMLFPFIRRFRVLFLSMVAVSCLGIALMVGLGGAYQSFREGCDSYIEEYAYPHGVISTSVTVENLLSKLENVEGVEAICSRMHGDLALKTQQRTITVRTYTVTVEDFQKFHVWQEAGESQDLQIWLETRFAENNGISAGDTVELKTAKGYQTFFVSKIVSSPECIHMEQSAYTWGDNSDFGYGFIPQEHAETVFGRDTYRNQYLFLFEKTAVPETVLIACEEALQGQTILDSFVYEDSLVKRAIDINTDPLKALSLLLPMLFFLLMLLMIVLFLSQIIRQCRREIGILRAIGFNRLQTAGLFCVIVLVVTTVASVLGLLLGRIVAGLTAGLYGEIAAIPSFPVTLPVRTCIQAAAITILTGQVAAIFSSAAIAKIQPSEAMRPKAPVAAKVPAWLKRLMSRLKPIAKFSIFSVFRNPGRFLAATLCIAAAMTLILSGLAFDYSKDKILTQIFDARFHYDCQILLQSYPDEKTELELAEVEGVTACERVVLLPVKVSFGDVSESTLINGIVTSGSLVRVLDEDGQEISIPETGIVLDRHLAQRLGVKKGDIVTVDGIPLTVTDLSDHHACRVQYTSREQALALSESCSGSFLVNTEAEEALIEHASSLPGYGGATFTRLLQMTTEESFRQFSVGVAIVLAFSFSLGLLIVFHMTRAAMSEQQQELGVLRILGFQRRQISMCWLGKTMIQYLLALLIGLPAGTAIAKYVLSQMSTTQREYPFSDHLGQFVITVLLVLGFVLASHFLAMAQMRKWNLAETSGMHE